MDELDQVEAGKAELQILRQLSSYKDEMIRRLYAEVILLRRCLQGIEGAPAKPSINGRTGRDLSHDSLRHGQSLPRYLVTPMQCDEPASDADLLNHRVHSTQRKIIQTPLSGPPTGIFPSSFLKLQTKGKYNGVTSGIHHVCQASIPKDIYKFTRALPRHGNSIKIPSHAVPKRTSHANTISSIGNTIQLLPASASVGCVTENGGRNAAMRQQLDLTQQHAMLRQADWPQNPGRAVPYVNSTNGGSVRSVLSNSESSVLGIATVEASFKTSRSRAQAQALRDVKLQLGNQWASKSRSTMSSGSTCSSATSSRRRPWDF